MALKYLSSDVYGITQLIEDIKTANIGGLDQLTLAMSIFGYFSEVASSLMQSAVVMASEYSNEAIPVKAKFEKNIITHALSLGIEKLNAQPAVISVNLGFPEDILVANMINDVFIFDKDMKIMIGDYEFHTDYDIRISRSTLISGEYVYTAMYVIDRQNPISEITNPYLPPVARVNTGNVPVIMIQVELHQVEYTQIHKKILSSNPLENKIFNFTFESQLAAFDLDVTENNESYHLTPVYDGLINDTETMYCYYNYMNTNEIRIKFEPDVYIPELNADVIVNLYTTQGSSGNFEWGGEDLVIILTSERYNYNKLYMQLTPITDSASGIDRKSIEELKRLIPKEALARGSVTNATDLNNYFNSINTDDVQLLFFKKIDNCLERLYYSFLLMKYDEIVVPTNTIPINLIRSNFNGITNDNYVFDVGHIIYYTGTSNARVMSDVDDDEMETMEQNGFVYMNPFMCVVNKSPFYVSYYLTIMDTTKFLNFEYINNKSQLQFIASQVNWKREYFTDRDKYKLDITLTQNIVEDMDIAIRDEEDNVIGAKMKVALVLYNADGEPYRYKFFDFAGYREETVAFDFQCVMTTEDIIDDLTSRIRIEDVYDIGTAAAGEDAYSYGYFDKNTTAWIYVYVQNQDGALAGRDDADGIIPDMQDYALSNKYSIINGIDFFYNYSHIMNSTVNVTKQNDTSLLYTINKMPVIRYRYINSEERLQTFIKQLEARRYYIEDCLEVLEDSFGIDFKFFNTYGPSKLFTVTGDPSRLDRVNLSLKFRCKLNTVTDRYIEDDIITLIKDSIENINDGIANLHMPNLITEITNQYREQLVFFEFIEFNDYGPAYKHIYRPDESLIDRIPEFLCVNVLDDGSPDISIEFVE